MNRTGVIWGIILLVVIAGGLWYATTVMQSPSPTATSTPSGANQGQPVSTNQPAPPTVVTGGNSGVSETTAILNGAVTPNGSFTNYWYEYGTSNSLGSKSVVQGIGSGYAAIPAPVYLTGLAKDTTYFYRLAAENQYGTVEGAIASVQTTHNVPPPVGGSPTATTRAASSLTRTAANLNGTVSPNKAATTYWFEYGTTANLGSITAFTSAGSGSASVAALATLTELTPATTYYFRLDAQNSFGTVSGSILTFKTPGPALSAAPVVTTLITLPATTTATLRGTVNPNGADTTYWFEYSTNSGFAQASLKTTSQQTVAAGAGTLSVETPVTGLTANTTYYYRMVAHNAGGTSLGDRQSFKTK